MSLDDLKTRIATAKQNADSDYVDSQKPTGAASGLGQGMRVGIEFVSAIGVSTFIGWALDQWLGTLPLALIVMFFLGCAAGFLNVYRLVQNQEKAAAEDRNDMNPAADHDEPGAKQSNQSD